MEETNRSTSAGVRKRTSRLGRLGEGYILRLKAQRQVQLVSTVDEEILQGVEDACLAARTKVSPYQGAFEEEQIVFGQVSWRLLPNDPDYLTKTALPVDDGRGRSLLLCFAPKDIVHGNYAKSNVEVPLTNII
jgi:hypothetical protein